MPKGIKDTIEAKGFAIQIYTEDFKNEYISLTDIARYKSDEPFIVINNWLRSKDNIRFLGLWESMHNPDFKPIEFDRFKNEAGIINVALFNKRAKQWREENSDLKGNMRDYASLNELLVLANMESYNAVMIGKGMEPKERMIELRNLARTQLMSLEKLDDSVIKELEGKKQ